LSAERITLAPGAPPIRGARVVPEARSAVSHALARARSAALAEGLARGRAEAQARAAGALDAAAEELETERRRACDALGESAVELAFEIARELVRVEVSAARHDIERMVRDTLESSSVGRSRCVVHLNPADVQALEGVPFRSGTTLEPDIGVARGDVHVETSLGLMVRELDGALESIAESLREMVR